MRSERVISKRAAAVLAAMTLVAPAAFVASSGAEPAQGVSAVVLSRAKLPEFKLKSAADAPFDLSMKAKDAMDFVIRQHDYQPHSTTGWHRHPGPVFITVTKGTLSYYLYDDPDCTRVEVPTGKSFVDDGRGHIVRNESGEAAQDISIITAAADEALPFRSNLQNPGPYCPF